MAFHFMKVRRVHGEGYSVLCRYHAGQVPNATRSFEPRPCSRELAIAGDPDEAADKASRVLKLWCLGCASAEDRAEHMDPKRFARKIPRPLPTHEELDAELEILKRSL